jgi:HAD superfamily hydrolase (TIGR01484 family)
MKPIDSITPEECRHIRGILFDIDDTFTFEGKIPSEAFGALWDLHAQGFILVPLTGRPAGWCDHMARMWPVDGVVGENGALYYYYDRHVRKLCRRYIYTPEEIARKRSELEAIRCEVLRRVPGAAVSADQPFRLFDLAIDFREDVPPLSEPEIQEICRIFREHHATYKISSIHVNGWFGEYNKLSTARLFLEERLGIPWDEAVRTFLFIGDSPNDEPMFQAMHLTVGVANIRKFAEALKYLPQYITTRSGGLGFAEMARKLIEQKGKYCASDHCSGQ